MEGIHVGFARRICTDASSKPLPIATYCLRTFHRLGTNPTVKTALHLPWSDFRASFGAEDAGIQEYSKDDKPEIAHVRRHGSLSCMPLFSPRKPRFRRRCAPLKVSLWRRMSADATGIFILTGDNALPLTAFALAFSPICPLSVAAFAALKVSFPGACPGKDVFLF